MRLGTATLVMVAFGVLTSGCSGGAGAQPTSLPSLTATPSPAVATVPPQATANTSQALDAFVRFYFQQLNVAFSTSDASIVRRWSDPICQTCNNYAKSLDAARDEFVQGESFGRVEVAAPPLNTGGTLVEAFGTVPPRRLRRRDGTLIKALPSGGTFHFTLNVIRTPSGWLVRGIKRGN